MQGGAENTGHAPKRLMEAIVFDALKVGTDLGIFRIHLAWSMS